MHIQFNICRMDTFGIYKSIPYNYIAIENARHKGLRQHPEMATEEGVIRKPKNY